MRLGMQTASQPAVFRVPLRILGRADFEKS